MSIIKMRTRVLLRLPQRSHNELVRKIVQLLTRFVQARLKREYYTVCLTVRCQMNNEAACCRCGILKGEDYSATI